MMPEPNRVRPALAVSHMKTYGFASPLATHWRRATCAEVECGGYTHGWKTIVPADSEQAQYIRAMSGRHFTEKQGDAPGLAEFTFSPGQMCFRAADHRMPLERPPLFVVRDGDWRGNPTGNSRRHVSADDWVDDFRTHQDRIAQAHQRG
jgi:hypothetical protein